MDLNHWWGDDLSLSPTGDLTVVGGLNKDNQRILRRLCTNGEDSGAGIGEYLFHPAYGGSAPWYIGRTTSELVLSGIIRAQMYQETSVLQSPEPQVTTTIYPNGNFTALIEYTNANTGKPVEPLLLDVSV